MIGDARYEFVRQLIQAEGRSVWFARDRITGSEVVVKTAPRPSILRELGLLLSVPPRVSAEVCDLLPTPAGGAALVTRRLKGRTLREAMTCLAPSDLPAMTAGICRRLATLHRAGFVHADIKPENVLVSDTPAGEIRLLDLAFSWSPSSPDIGDETVLGGTPPYAAPELRRGWRVDARADQYSLGITLILMRPSLVDDPVWSPIVNRMTELQPSRRFPDVIRLADEIEAAFGLRSSPMEPPCFGCGPLRGRSVEMDSVLREAGECRPGSLLLVQARPGTGLSRFLLECAGAIVRREGPALRIVDLGGGRAHSGDLHFLEERLAEGERILLGLDDPSPALCWRETHPPDRLRNLIRSMRPWSLRLRSLGADVLGDIAGLSLGASGAAIEALGRTLHARTAGDLRLVAEGFAHAVETCGIQEGLTWKLAPGALDEPPWRPPAPPPSWLGIPAEARRSLQILARIGCSFGREDAAGLLERFDDVTQLEHLIEQGLVVDADAGRVSFVHAMLHEAAESEALDVAAAIDLRLNETYAPPAEDIRQRLAAAQRAHRLGDLEREQRLLEDALLAAETDDRWDDVKGLFTYLHGDSFGSSLAASWSDLLGSQWPRERILGLMGRCLHTIGDTAGLSLLDAAAESCTSPSGVECLFLLAQIDRTAHRMDSYQQRLTLLLRLEAEGRGPMPGCLDLERSRAALFAGRKDEARELAEQAMLRLAGSGTRHEPASLMTLAALSMPDRPRAAIELLEQALGTTRQRGLRAMIHMALSQIYEILGDLESLERSAQAALDEMEGGRSHRHASRLLARRAWAWVLLDRAAEAATEAEQLLQFTAVRGERPQLAFAQLLAGFAALHGGHGRAAVARMAEAWDLGKSCLSPKPRADLLRYLLDALLDLHAWDLVTAHAEDLAFPGASDEPSVRLTALRREALLAQARGAHREAVALLDAALPDARQQSDRLDSARFQHHLGIARLGAGLEARPVLRQALEQFGTIGYGYFRGRTLVALALAEADRGTTPAALEYCDQAVELARRIGSRGVLAEALEARAHLVIHRS